MKKILIFITVLFIFLLPTTDDIDTEPMIKTLEKPRDTFGYINIPKISLNGKFVYNGNIDKKIIMVPPSTYPDIENSLLILAGHSGTGRYAYFNYLYKLAVNDTIIITYMNEKYIYKIIDIYYQEKDGNIDIYRKSNAKTLVLVTCTNNNKKYQTVYIAISND